MIEVVLNGEKYPLESHITIEELILRSGFRPQWVVVEYNGEALLKKDYSKTQISSGDRIELVRAVSGG